MRQIDIHTLADEARFNRFHGLVLFWCALIIIFDGYDLAVVGIALPSLMKDLAVDPAKAGFMVSSALVGMAFGAIGLGTMADRIGRRWTIAICIALFSVFTGAATPGAVLGYIFALATKALSRADRTSFWVVAMPFSVQSAGKK